MQKDGTLLVPDVPVVPYITGDGVGAEVTPAMQAVVDAAIRKAYGGKRRIEWKEVLAGERAFNATGSWLPDETMETFQEYLVGIKGPLTTPVGGGIRSLNVALRQTLDLYVCLRPVRWYHGVQSPVKSPENERLDTNEQDADRHTNPTFGAKLRSKNGFHRRQELSTAL